MQLIGNKNVRTCGVGVAVMMAAGTLAFAQAAATAPDFSVPSPDFPAIFKQISLKDNAADIRTDAPAEFQILDGVDEFSSDLPLLAPAKIDPVDALFLSDEEKAISTFQVRTVFDAASPTIRKRSVLHQGPLRASFTTTLMNNRGPLQQKICRYGGKDFKVYYDDADVFVYSQTAHAPGSVDLKEWIYASIPNDLWGSTYTWEFRSDELEHFVFLDQEREGGVGLYRYPVIKGVSDKQFGRQRHIVEVLDQVLKNRAVIHDYDRLAKISGVVYWTRQGVKKTGDLLIQGRDLIVQVGEPKSSYPLLIDPSMAFFVSWQEGGDE